jgi:FkbM family methyltransferase
VKDYSQHQEQATILARFYKGDLSAGNEAFVGEPGRFLDIGAWHPTQFSNTRALFELGWSGVMFEPSPGPMLNLLDAYGAEPRVTLVQACVSVEGGVAELMVTDDAVSTASIAEFIKWRDTAKFRGPVLVPSVTVADIGQRFGGFDFVNIDAEGQSADIFLEFLRLGMYPNCVCCEHDSRQGQIIEAATAQHYQVVLANSTNLVMVRG